VCGFHAYSGGVGRRVGLPKGKRTRRSKLQKKDSEYLYEFEDTDTEEDQAAQDTSGDGDRNYHANSDSTLFAYLSLFSCYLILYYYFIPLLYILHSAHSNVHFVA
jgi:hypothetical protein